MLYVEARKHTIATNTRAATNSCFLEKGRYEALGRLLRNSADIAISCATEAPPSRSVNSQGFEASADVPSDM